MKKLLLLFVLVLFAPPINTFAQIEYTNSPPIDANEMAQRLVGAGVEVFNAELLCGDNGSGYFWNGDDYDFGIESGIILTTGTTSIAFSPNDSGSASGGGGPGYPPLEEFPNAYNGTFNACVLEFDFVPYGSEINLNYIFGSEEYPEWVGSQFNDIFAFLIEGFPEYPSEMPLIQRNIALIPGSPSPGIPVSINLLNPNTEYYITNQGIPTSSVIQYDGYTVRLPAYASITPCNTYHLTLAIADVSDTLYDSGLFFEENSFQSSIPQVQSIATNIDENSETIVENCSEAIASFSLGFVPLKEHRISVSTYLLEEEGLQVLIGGTATQYDDFLLESDEIVFPATEDATDLFPEIPLQELRIIPVADNIEEATEYITIGVYSACNSEYLSIDTIFLVDELKAEIVADIGVCEANKPITLWANGGESYHWSPSDYLDCPECPNPTATVPETTTYFVNIEKAGCIEQKSVTIFVEESLQAAQLEEEWFTCSGESITLEASGGLTYEWQGIEGSPIENLSCVDCPNPIFTPSISMGIFSYSVQISSGDNCTETLTATVQVDNTELDISATPSNICKGESLILTADGTAENYLWTNSVGEVVGTTSNVEVSPESDETYTATTQGVSCPASQSVFIEVCQLEAIIEASSTFVCQGESITLTALGDGEHIWLDSENNILGTGDSLVVAPTENTSYQLQFSQGTFTDLTEIIIAVEPELSIQIFPENPIICDTDDAIQLEIVNAIEGVVYEWEAHPDLEVIGDQGKWAKASPDSDETFRVQAISPAGCLLSQEVSVQVGGEELQLSIDAPEIICMDLSQPLPITIYAYGADSYTWQPFGPLLPLTSGSNEAIYFPNPLNNDVVLSVTGTNQDGTCLGTLEFQIQTFEAPNLSVAVEGLCKGEMTTLEMSIEGGSGNFDYQWLPVNGLTHPNSASTQAVVENEATYTLTIRDLDIGCEIVKTVAIQKTDVTVLSPTYFSFCEGETTATFAVEGGVGANYSWSDIDGNPLEETEGSLTVSPTESGTYSVEATTLGGCQRRIDFEVEKLPLPTIEIIEIPEVVCSGEVFVLELEGANEYVLQSTNNIPFDYQFIALNQVEVTTDEDLELEITGISQLGCSNTTQASIEVSKVEAFTPFEVNICGEEGTATLGVNGGTGATYDWQPPIGLSTTSEASVEVSPSDIDFYTAHVVTAEGCEHTLGFEVTVSEIPEISVSSDFVEACQGDAIQLELSGAIEYTFNERNNRPFDLKYLSDGKVEIIVEEDLDLEVIGTDELGCSGESSVQVVDISIEVEVSPSVAVCFGESVEMWADAGEGASYLWSPAESLSDPTVANPITSTTETTLYTVETIDANGCRKEHKVVIAVLQELTVDLVATTTTFCANSTNPIVLQATPYSYSIYTFYDGEGTVIAQNSEGQIVVTPSTTTTYGVSIESQDGCSATDEATITVENLQIEVPEKFVVCAEELLTISPSSNFSNLSYQWSPTTGLNDPTLASPVFSVSETTTYSLIATTEAGCTNTIETTIEVATDCVFPGDTDNNGTVDIFDLFPLGQHFGKQEFARNSISNEWRGFGVEDWSEAQSNGQNLKYADCNGNSKIGFEDTTAIVQNFGLQQKTTHFSKGKLGDPELQFLPNFETIGLDEWLELEVWIGSSENPVTDLYAIAFETSVDVDLIDMASVAIDFNSSQLGNYGEDLLAIDWVNSESGHIHVSLSQTNGSGISGQIHLLTIRMKSKTDLENPENLPFEITDFGGTTSNEVPVLVNLEQLPNITIDPAVVHIETTTALSKPYQLYPTFTQNGIHLQYQSHQNQSVKVRLFNYSGQFVGTLWQQSPSNVGKQYIDLKSWNLSTGVYIVELEVDGATYREKIVWY